MKKKKHSSHVTDQNLKKKLNKNVGPDFNVIIASSKIKFNKSEELLTLYCELPEKQLRRVSQQEVKKQNKTKQNSPVQY